MCVKECACYFHIDPSLFSSLTISHIKEAIITPLNNFYKMQILTNSPLDYIIFAYSQNFNVNKNQ